MNLACPNCSTAVADDPTMWGKVVACPSCGISFQFPFPKPDRQSVNVYAAPQTRPAASRHRSRVLPHSGPGIASFVIGFFGFVWMTVIILMARRMAQKADSADDIYSALFGVAFWFILHALWSTLGVALGIVGLFQLDRNRWFAGIGTILNAIPLAFVLYILIQS